MEVSHIMSFIMSFMMSYLHGSLEASPELHLSAGLTSCAALRSSHWAECQGIQGPLLRRGSYVFP